MRSIIEKLHEHEIFTIIGDFGSGTDSIGFLKSEPVDAVSIDGQFTCGIEDTEADRAILSHLTGIASACIKHINVKGVDSKEIYDILREFGVTTMQGKYFSEKISAAQLIEKYYG